MLKLLGYQWSVSRIISKSMVDVRYGMSKLNQQHQ